MPRINLGTHSLNCQLDGAGEPVLLIPGLSGNLLGWTQTQVPDLVAAGYSCIAMDNRDVGGSDSSPVCTYSIKDMAHDAALLLDALGVASAHIVGWSMGGMIAQELALNHLQKVRSLTLNCTDFGQSPHLHAWIRSLVMLRPRCSVEEFARLMIPWIFSEHSLANPETERGFLNAVMADPHPQGADQFVRQASAIVGHDTRERLAQLYVPTLVVAGQQDILTPPARAHALAAAIPHAQLHVLAHVGHAACWEDTPNFNAALLAFLRAQTR